MKSSRAKQVLSVIKHINSLPRKQQEQFVKCCDKSDISCICECAKNILRGNIKLSQSQLSKLRKHKAALRSLSLKGTSLKTKRKILQKGGFLGQLLVPAITLLTSLFNRD